MQSALTVATASCVKSSAQTTTGIQQKFAAYALVLAVLLVTLVIAMPSAYAQTYTESLLYSFCSKINKKTKACTDGELPLSGLAIDKKDNLYGMTFLGGKGVCSGIGCGTVFKVTTTDKESVLHSFTGATGVPTDGAGPNYFDNLILDSKGNLYGTTEYGGTGTCTGPFQGCGVIFEITGTKETVLYNFQGGADGYYPEGGLLLDTAGNLYGTTSGGGTSKHPLGGTLFKFDPGSETKTILYDFCSVGACSDGGTPTGSLIMDSSGNNRRRRHRRARWNRFQIGCGRDRDRVA
jgi:uncharacterized repeat protein (TIGR03803 family)